MSQSAYPAAADVATAIVAQGFTAPSNLAAIVNGVVSEFERRTGYKPFLGDVADTVWSFDSPYRNRNFELDLEGGFWAITSIYYMVTTTSAGILAVTGTDYKLLPINAAGDSRGWDKVRFTFHPGFGGDSSTYRPGYGDASIQVTGKRGYAQYLPDDVYQAIFDECMGRGIATGSTGPGAELQIKQGGFEARYADLKGKTGKATVWTKAFDDTILRYLRMP